MDKYWVKKNDRAWSAEEIKRAIDLKAEGYSTAEIGVMLGRTKNAVCGNLYRHASERRDVIGGRGFWQHPQRLLRLRKLYFGANGYSQDELAQKFGITKSVLQKGIKMIREAPTTTRKLTAKLPPRAPAKPLPAPVTAHVNGEKGGLKTLIELQYGDCKWPFGDHDFKFCGVPAIPGMPYCREHTRIAKA